MNQPLHLIVLRQCPLTTLHAGHPLRRANLLINVNQHAGDAARSSIRAAADFRRNVKPSPAVFLSHQAALHPNLELVIPIPDSRHQSPQNGIPVSRMQNRNQGLQVIGEIKHILIAQNPAERVTPAHLGNISFGAAIHRPGANANCLADLGQLIQLPVYPRRNHPDRNSLRIDVIRLAQPHRHEAAPAGDKRGFPAVDGFPLLRRYSHGVFLPQKPPQTAAGKRQEILIGIAEAVQQIITGHQNGQCLIIVTDHGACGMILCTDALHRSFGSFADFSIAFGKCIIFSVISVAHRYLEYHGFVQFHTRASKEAERDIGTNGQQKRYVLIHLKLRFSEYIDTPPCRLYPVTQGGSPSPATNGYSTPRRN